MTTIDQVITPTNCECHVTVTVPRKFYWDHVERDCAGGIVINENKMLVTAWVDVDTYEDLLGDAKHYASDAMDDYYSDYPEERGLKRSAASAVRRLEAVNQPAPFNPAAH